MGLPPKVYHVLVSIVAALGSFLYGYNLTIVAEGMPLFSYCTLTHQVSLIWSVIVASHSFIDQFQPITVETGLVAALLITGAVIGAALAGWVSDHLGRRATILAGGAFFCLGGAL
jgi:MFS family permease